MHSATVTFRIESGSVWSTEISEESQLLFYAAFMGAVKGAVGAGASVINVVEGE